MEIFKEKETELDYSATFPVTVIKRCAQWIVQNFESLENKNRTETLQTFEQKLNIWPGKESVSYANIWNGRGKEYIILKQKMQRISRLSI